MRVVLDTNVYISAILFGGVPELPIRLAGVGRIDLLVSDAILNELSGVLREKFQWSPEQIAEVGQEVRNRSKLVRVRSRIRTINDDDADNRILECAADGQADLIISGDRHLLALGSYQGIRVVSPRQFADEVGHRPPA